MIDRLSQRDRGELRVNSSCAVIAAAIDISPDAISMPM